MIKQIIKAALSLSIILMYMLSALICSPYQLINKYKFKKLSSRLMMVYCKILNIVLGLQVNFINQEIIPKNSNFLFISNHVSYLDIFSIAQRLSLSFITSYEMKQRPGVGQLCTLGGCSYVERRKDKRNKESRKDELRDIYQNLENDINIGLYPEATSTNGQEVISFKKPMFIPVYNLKKPVLVSVINYKSLNYEPLSIKNRDEIFWYGAMDLIPHLWAYLKNSRVEVEITFLELVDSNKFESVEELIQYCREIVINRYLPIK